MSYSESRTIHLKDYTPPRYWVDTVELSFRLDEEQTRVHSTLALRRNPEVEAGPLVLDGQQLTLAGLRLDGRPLAENEYRVDDDTLTIAEVPERFTLEVETVINPKANTALEGLYLSGGNFCTQCEAEGFRRITYYPDRPDVMAVFTTRIEAAAENYPVLLSNGNPVEQGELEDGRHYAVWHDPFPKPCYLFALVAGNLVRVADSFTTMSGREIPLHIYVREPDADKCDHAMASLKHAMRWDEQVYGREYDLDLFMIVAVDDFNMGAMENKGLNVFNSKFILARPETATDDDYGHIEGVVAHEYFHNWSGNRVTCRDWFQLSLKEGFTVFRDQTFSADMGSRAVQRIGDVRFLRTFQFAEDAGPMAHPVRPDAYEEINNFYTATVYHKGAEVVRMIHQLLGAEAFRRGTDLYFERHDGQAVTTDDFVRAMEAANGIDLTRFRRWYSQAGTPRVAVERHYDATTQRYTLTLRQSCPPTPGQPQKAPFHIPVAMGLVGADGAPLPLRLEGESEAAGTDRVLALTEAEQRFTFLDIPAEPVPSLLRGFSAPVKLECDYREAELAFLMAHDEDLFNRWDAGQRLATGILLRLVEAWRRDEPLELPTTFIDACRRLLTDEGADKALRAMALELPGEAYLAEQMALADPEAIAAVRRFARRTLAEALQRELAQVYTANESNAPYRYDAEESGRRRLKNLCLGYLMELDDAAQRARCLAQFEGGNNMTDVIAALGALSHCDCPEREQALATFYHQWQAQPLVVDKWFSLQAMSRLPDTLESVQRLMRHPDFNIRNPNRARALIGAFARGNPANFHDASGGGYRFLADRVLELDALNPQVAARMLEPLTHWKRLIPALGEKMRGELERIAAAPKLSRDVSEVVGKSLV